MMIYSVWAGGEPTKEFQLLSDDMLQIKLGDPLLVLDTGRPSALALLESMILESSSFQAKLPNGTMTIRCYSVHGEGVQSHWATSVYQFVDGAVQCLRDGGVNMFQAVRQ